jgi:hypothetical protein
MLGDEGGAGRAVPRRERIGIWARLAQTPRLHSVARACNSTFLPSKFNEFPRSGCRSKDRSPSGGSSCRGAMTPFASPYFLPALRVLGADELEARLDALGTSGYT